MARRALASALMIGLVVFVGCRSVTRPDAGEEVVKVVDFGSKDFQLIVEKMVDSLISVQIGADPSRRPICYIHRLGNRTSEHIDTQAMLKTIRTRLIRAGKFTFVDPTQRPEILKQLEDQSSDLIDQSTAVKYGRLLGADYFLYGDISSITAKAGRKRGVYYNVTLNLLDIERGAIIWADEKEIQKVEKRGIFGL